MPSEKPQPLHIKINGTEHFITEYEPTAPLSHTLREVFALRGTKVGCGQGNCGACTVHVRLPTKVGDSPATLGDLRAVNACLFPTGSLLVTREVDISRAQQHISSASSPDETSVSNSEKDTRLIIPEVTTIESVPVNDKIARAVADCNGSQCGFCTPGIVMSAKAYVADKERKKKNNSTPSSNNAGDLCDIEDVLCGNLCRCTGYRPILYALKTTLGDEDPANLPRLKAEINHTPACVVRNPATGNFDNTYANAGVAHENVKIVWKSTKKGIHAEGGQDNVEGDEDTHRNQRKDGNTIDRLNNDRHHDYHQDPYQSDNCNNGNSQNTSRGTTLRLQHGRGSGISIVPPNSHNNNSTNARGYQFEPSINATTPMFPLKTYTSAKSPTSALTNNHKGFPLNATSPRSHLSSPFSDFLSVSHDVPTADGAKAEQAAYDGAPLDLEACPRSGDHNSDWERIASLTSSLCAAGDSSEGSFILADDFGVDTPVKVPRAAAPVSTQIRRQPSGKMARANNSAPTASSSSSGANGSGPEHMSVAFMNTATAARFDAKFNSPYLGEQQSSSLPNSRGASDRRFNENNGNTNALHQDVAASGPTPTPPRWSAPKTEEALSVLLCNRKAEACIVAGNVNSSFIPLTSKSTVKTFVSLAAIDTLNGISVLNSAGAAISAAHDNDSLSRNPTNDSYSLKITIPANATITQLIAFLQREEYTVAQPSGRRFIFINVINHLKTIGNPQVRNLGTVVGNIVASRQRGAPTDIGLAFASMIEKRVNIGYTNALVNLKWAENSCKNDYVHKERSVDIISFLNRTEAYEDAQSFPVRTNTNPHRAIDLSYQWVSGITVTLDSSVTFTRIGARAENHPAISAVSCSSFELNDISYYRFISVGTPVLGTIGVPPRQVLNEWTVSDKTLGSSHAAFERIAMVLERVFEGDALAPRRLLYQGLCGRLLGVNTSSSSSNSNAADKPPATNPVTLLAERKQEGSQGSQKFPVDADSSPISEPIIKPASYEQSLGKAMYVQDKLPPVGCWHGTYILAPNACLAFNPQYLKKWMAAIVVRNSTKKSASDGGGSGLGADGVPLTPNYTIFTSYDIDERSAKSNSDKTAIFTMNCNTVVNESGLDGMSAKGFVGMFGEFIFAPGCTTYAGQPIAMILHKDEFESRRMARIVQDGVEAAAKNSDVTKIGIVKTSDRTGRKAFISPENINIMTGNTKVPDGTTTNPFAVCNDPDVFLLDLEDSIEQARQARAERMSLLNAACAKALGGDRGYSVGAGGGLAGGGNGQVLSDRTAILRTLLASSSSSTSKKTGSSRSNSSSLQQQVLKAADAGACFAQDGSDVGLFMIKRDNTTMARGSATSYVPCGDSDDDEGEATGERRAWLNHFNKNNTANDDVIFAQGIIKAGSQTHLYMETQNSLCIPEDDRFCVYASSQTLTALQERLAAVFNKNNESNPLAKYVNSIVVQNVRIGGGFGGKEPQAVPTALASLICAVILKAPVRINTDRLIDFDMFGKRHAVLGAYKVAVDLKSGRISHMDLKFRGDAGCSHDCSGPVLELSCLTSDNMYDIPNFRCSATPYLTHKQTGTAFRSFGVVQSMTITETAIEHAFFSLVRAREARGLSPSTGGGVVPINDVCEFRAINFYPLPKKKKQSDHQSAVKESNNAIMTNSKNNSNDALAKAGSARGDDDGNYEYPRCPYKYDPTTGTFTNFGQELFEVDRMYGEDGVWNKILRKGYTPDALRGNGTGTEADENYGYLKALKDVEAFNKKNKYRKQGISLMPLKYGIAYTFLMFNQGSCNVSAFTSDGSVLVQTTGVEMGQGLYTKIAQTVSAVLDIPMALIKIGPASTDAIPNGPGTSASLGADLNIPAVLDACGQLKARLEQCCDRTLYDVLTKVIKNEALSRLVYEAVQKDAKSTNANIAERARRVIDARLSLPLCAKAYEETRIVAPSAETHYDSYATAMLAANNNTSTTATARADDTSKPAMSWEGILTYKNYNSSPIPALLAIMLNVLKRGAQLNNNNKNGSNVTTPTADASSTARLSQFTKGLMDESPMAIAICDNWVTNGRRWRKINRTPEEEVASPSDSNKKNTDETRAAASLDNEARWRDVCLHALFVRTPLLAQGFSMPDADGDKELNTKNLFFYYNYGAAWTQVEIDVLTGEADVIRTDIIYDAGMGTNAATDIGQIEGGFIQGLGNMLTESVTYDKNTGRLNERTMLSYAVPDHRTIPRYMNVELLWKNGQGGTESKKSTQYIPSIDAKHRAVKMQNIKRGKTTGEPPLILSVTVLNAIRNAVMAARLEFADAKDRETVRNTFVVVNSPMTPQNVLAALWGSSHPDKGFVLRPMRLAE